MYKRLAAIPATLLALSLTMFSCGSYVSQGMVSLKSPDGRIELNFELKAMPEPYMQGENMYYKVMRDGKALLRESPLGMNFGGYKAALGDMLIMGLNQTSGVDDFDTPFSKQSHVRLEYNEVTVTLREKSIPAKTFDLIFRAYNEGLAFRYHFPEQEPKISIPSAKHSGFITDFILVDEYTGYYFAQDVDVNCMFTTPLPPHQYESHYAGIKLSQITRDSTAALPMLIRVPEGPALCIAQAELVDYPAFYLTGARNIENAFNTMLVPLPGEKEVKGIGKVPFSTPWRVIMIADNAGKLIESNLILALSSPQKLEDISWIKPGKASWDWWSGKVVGKSRGRVQAGGFETSTYVHYIDFAREAGLQYCLIDAGWYGGDQNPDEDITAPVLTVDMEYLTRYADSLGVKLILWLNWENVSKQIDAAFPLYEKWGIAGVKIDYMNRDDQEMVAFYQTVVEKAAQHHLLVDFHGAYPPTGMRRAWPNLITREGVLGLEYNKWSDWASPEHDVTIPYTRMLVGPMDYTPGAINNSTRKSFNPRNIDPMSQGTRCHQLAMFVVYESPLTVLADSPDNYRGEKGLDFIKVVPTVWDETRFLAGEVSQYIVLARKSGDKWYLGAMTNWDPREVEVPLDFLGSGNWKAKVWADGVKIDKNPSDVDVLQLEVNSGAPLAIKMGPGGGFAAVLEQAQ